MTLHRHELDYARPMKPTCERRTCAVAVTGLVMSILGCPCLSATVVHEIAKTEIVTDARLPLLLILIPAIATLLAVIALARIEASKGELKGGRCARIAAVMGIVSLPLAIVAAFLLSVHF